MAKNKEAWLGLYADDAVIMDPVGVSPLDPTGLGQRGKEAISQFWDMVIAPGEMDFRVQSSHPAGQGAWPGRRCRVCRSRRPVLGRRMQRVATQAVQRRLRGRHDRLRRAPAGQESDVLLRVGAG